MNWRRWKWVTGRGAVARHQSRRILVCAMVGIASHPGDEFPAGPSMATLTPDSYSDSDSDTDSYGDSDYGYDLTAEEEAAVANLVARASSKAAGPVLIASTASRSTVANPSLEVDVNAAVFAHASDGSRAREDRTVGRANHDGDFTYHNQPGVPSALARGAKRLASTTASHDASLAIVVDRPKPRSVPTLATTDDLRYPDCESRQLLSCGRSGMALTDLKALSE